MPGRLVLTRRRLTSLGAVLLAGPGLSTSAAAQKFDRSRIGALRFSEDFADFRPYGESARTGRWRTQFGHGQVIDGEFSRTHGDKELQCYVDPGFAGLGLDPFRILRSRAGSALRISLWPTPPHARAACFGRPFVSGMLSSEPCIAMEQGYWEVAARLPRYVSGIWPGIWLLPSAALWPPEIDLIEVVKGEALCTSHTAQNGRHEFDSTRLPALGDLSDRVHTFGLMHDGRWLTWHIDGLQVKRTPVAADQRRPFFLLVNLCIAEASARGPIAPDTRADMVIEHIRAYALRT